MTENEPNPEELAEFREKYRQSLKEEFLELVMVSGTSLPPDPYSMGLDERTFEELSLAELTTVRDTLYEEFGLEVENLEAMIHRRYKTMAAESARVPGEIMVTVYRTNRQEEDLFLHELTYQDEQQRWMVGPDEDL